MLEHKGCFNELPIICLQNINKSPSMGFKLRNHEAKRQEDCEENCGNSRPKWDPVFKKQKKKTLKERKKELSPKLSVIKFPLIECFVAKPSKHCKTSCFRSIARQTLAHTPATNWAGSPSNRQERKPTQWHRRQKHKLHPLPNLKCIPNASRISTFNWKKL